ncbi:hypothetical protein DRQ33_01305 [bacterium]|nr:MAG: hypothetical protein DRQ33_01305 [bacterium]
MNIIKIWEIVRKLWDDRKLTMPIILAFFLGSIMYALFLPNEYTSTAKFLPSGAGGGPFGFISGWLPNMIEKMTEEGISSFLFPDMLKSRTVLVAVAREPFDSTLKKHTGKQNLMEYHNWNTPDDIVKGFSTYGVVYYSFDKGITEIKYTANDPRVAYFGATTWIDKLFWYLEDRLQTEARRNYGYLKERYNEVKRSLKNAEDSLTAFIKTHRNYDSDAIVNLEYKRLLTMVESRRNIYEFIVQQMENEKLDMVKAVPTVKILDSPAIPTKKSGPQRSLIVAVGSIIGLFVAIILLILKNAAHRLKEHISQKNG